MSYWYANIYLFDCWWVSLRPRLECVAICKYLDENANQSIRHMLFFPAQASGYLQVVSRYAEQSDNLIRSYAICDHVILEGGGLSTYRVTQISTKNRYCEEINRFGDGKSNNHVVDSNIARIPIWHLPFHTTRTRSSIQSRGCDTAVLGCSYDHGA